MELADFLLARIAEDEADAQKVRARAADAFGGDPHAWVVVGMDDATGVDYDPARVLAECEAKRRIVELMVNDVKDARRRPGWSIPDSEVDEKGRDYRVGYENARAQQLPDVLDRTERVLRLLALPYADHPDYDEALRP